jgi:hypothetical protein
MKKKKQEIGITECSVRFTYYPRLMSASLSVDSTSADIKRWMKQKIVINDKQCKIPKNADQSIPAFPRTDWKNNTITLHSNRIGCLPSTNGIVLPLYINYLVAMGIDGRLWGFRTFLRANPSRIVANSTLNPVPYELMASFDWGLVVEKSDQTLFSELKNV